MGDQKVGQWVVRKVEHLVVQMAGSTADQKVGEWALRTAGKRVVHLAD
jgi:hypothetical protein